MPPKLDERARKAGVDREDRPDITTEIAEKLKAIGRERTPN